MLGECWATAAERANRLDCLLLDEHSDIIATAVPLLLLPLVIVVCGRRSGESSPGPTQEKGEKRAFQIGGQHILPAFQRRFTDQQCDQLGEVEPKTGQYNRVAFLKNHSLLFE